MDQLESSSSASFSERFLQRASDRYDEITFATDALYNGPAPEPWVAFMMGAVSFNRLIIPILLGSTTKSRLSQVKKLTRTCSPFL